MRIRSKGFHFVYLCIFCLFMPLQLAGCQGGPGSSHNRVVLPAKRVALQDGGFYPGQWETVEFRLSYRYAKTMDSIKISGELVWHDDFTISFSQLEYFTLWVHFLDGEGRVIDRYPVAHAPYMKAFQTMRFYRELHPGSLTKAMAFSYHGNAITEKRTGDEWAFWHHPFE